MLCSTVNKGLKSRIKEWITPYSHAAIVVASNDAAKAKISHVWATYKLEDQSKYNYVMYQETFRVLPDNLISPKFRKQLLESLGITDGELRNHLQSMYKNITQDLHKIENFQNKTLENETNKQKMAGVADFIPFGHKGLKSNRKWAEKALENKKDIAEHLVGKDKKGNSKNIICSEFTAKMTLLALVELEQQLVTKIQEKTPDFKIKTGELIKIPFNEFEDLSKVHPARLIKILQKANAIEKIEQQKFGQNFIRGG